MRLVLTAAVLLVLGGCARFLPAPVPMRAVDYPSPQGRGKCLLVFLPGMGDDAEDFEKNGFTEEVRRHGLSIDMVAAQATIGYYSRGTFVERLSADVVAPRRARGYAQTWLVGPSMGGFGTLFYSRQRTDDVTGVLALAPYLGDDDLIKEIHDAGGLQKWTAPARATTLDDSNYQREMWRWLQAVVRGKEPAPIIHVGFGRQDKLVFADELLAAELPKERVFRTEGGHTWGPWRTLLAQFLDQGEMEKLPAMTSMTPLRALSVLLAYPAAAAGAADGEPIIARARAAEAAEVRALAGTPIQLHTHGFVNDGKTIRRIESFRRIQYRADGTVINQFERATLDGKPIDEVELRKAIGAQDHKKEPSEILTYALAPLSSPDMEVTAVGPAPAGGFTLRCKPKHDALVATITLIVDAQTGHKRTASMEIAGLKAKLADRIENLLIYDDDGGPADFHASFHVKLAWIERSAEFASKRISPHK